MRVEPDSWSAYAFDAWVLAACPDGKFRDGKGAVLSATKACELSRWCDARAITALAAAFAETGDFEQAKRFQNKAIELLGDEEAKAGAREALELYRQKKAFRLTRE
jgi:Flp pilus assembly protein TadD